MTKKNIHKTRIYVASPMDQDSKEAESQLRLLRSVLLQFLVYYAADHPVPEKDLKKQIRQEIAQLLLGSDVMVAIYDGGYKTIGVLVEMGMAIAAAMPIIIYRRPNHAVPPYVENLPGVRIVSTQEKVWSILKYVEEER